MKLGLVGCGRMGKALAVGALEAGAVKPADLIAFDLHRASVEALHKEKDIVPANSLNEVIANSEILLLCTKPHDVPGVLHEIAAAGTARHELLVISVAAGLTIQTLERDIIDNARVIRAMPNTPALIGKGAAAFTLGSTATPEDAETARQLLGAVGLVVEVKEALMDAVTGLSGSGPGYVYLVIEALADGGVKNGLPRAQALELAAQAVLGTAAMVLATGEHPAVLRDMVTSPGGTTIAGIAALEARSVRAAFIEAVTASAEKAAELGKA